MSNTNLKIVRLSKADKIIQAEIHLNSSKSQSNRALIIQALSKNPIQLNNLSSAKDTQILLNILKEDAISNAKEKCYDVGGSGTAMRFLTAYFATKSGTRILTGNQRMKQRPIKPLVGALLKLGASISFLEKDGFPPLKITGKILHGNEVEIDGKLSSQYISALLLISPQLYNGLVINFTGKITSRPYINMTMKMMEHFNVSSSWGENSIRISNQQYTAEEDQPYSIEADWSSASYWYSLAALAQHADIRLYGLNQKSLQGDSILKDLYVFLGIKTEFIEGGVRLTKIPQITEALGFDYSDCPDIAQTVIVTAAGLSIPILLNGLQTLKIKETDRMSALCNELKKLAVNVQSGFSDSLEIKEYRQISASSSAKLPSPSHPVETYDDHRMAMSFAPLALRYNSIDIVNPDVVTKSYPKFWSDLKSAGFNVEELKPEMEHYLP